MGRQDVRARAYLSVGLGDDLPGRGAAAVLGGFAAWLLLFFAMPAAAQQGQDDAWREIKQEDGIRILVRNGDREIIKVKAVTTVPVAIDTLQAVIDDAAGHPEWVPYLIETRVLRSSDSEALLYSRFDAPWPARDRDFVYHSSIRRDSEGRLIYRLRSQESPLMPAQQDYVRGVLMEGVYTLTPLDDGRTRLEFMFYADPRGKLPLWIVNIVQRRFPYEALLGLKQRLVGSAAEKQP